MKNSKIKFDTIKHSTCALNPSFFRYPANRISWYTLVFTWLWRSYTLSVRKVKVERTVYQITNITKTILDSTGQVIGNKEIGGIKLYYTAKYQKPVYLWGIFLFYKTIRASNVIFYRPLKLHWSNAGKELDYEIGGKKNDQYVKCWLRINQDFNNIYRDQYIIGQSIDEYIVPSKNNELYKSLSNNQEIIIS